jgi:hypothetical protein
MKSGGFRMPSVILIFIKLKIRLAMMGKKVKATNPKIQGDRKVKPHRISRRPIVERER